MDAAGGLCFRDALHAVYAAFILQAGIGASTLDGKADLFITTQFSFIGVDRFKMPTVQIRIHAVHPVQDACKQCGLFAAGAGTDFDDDVFVVVWIFRQQKKLDFLFVLTHALLGGLEFLLGQLIEFPIAAAHQLLRFFHRRLCRLIIAEFFDDRRQVFQLFLE